MTGTRELRSIERSIRFMESIDAANEAIPVLKEGVGELREAVELDDHEVIDQTIEEMRQAMSNYMGMEYMDGGDDDKKLVRTSMESAMRSMKGNAPSHDYSRDDGEYEAAMDDMEGGDDDMEESEYIAFLEDQLEEHRNALRTVTSAYITSKGLNRIPNDQQASFMESLKESGQRPDEFDSLTLFEEYFDGEVARFLGEDVDAATPQSPRAVEVNPLLSEDSQLFQNIQYLSGKLNS